MIKNYYATGRRAGHWGGGEHMGRRNMNRSRKRNRNEEEYGT